jgi:hypothetical protein
LSAAAGCCSAQAQNPVEHTIIADAGAATPAGANYFRFNSLELNSHGDVAFHATLSGLRQEGIFATDGKGIAQIALGSPNANPISLSSITANGDVIFDTESGTFRGNGVGIVPLVQSGDPAPGGGTLTLDAGGSSQANSRGVIAFTSSVAGGSSTVGVFRTDGTHTVAIVTDSTLPPTGGQFTLLDQQGINRRGQTAVYTNMTGGAADFAIFRGDGEVLTPVFITHQIGPEGETFVDFGLSTINNRGQIATSVSTTDGSVLGIFLGDGAQTTAIALTGHAAPAGGTYNGDYFAPGPFVNDRGQVAFLAGLRDGTSTTGLFRGDGITTRAIALLGAPAPGTTGTFASFVDVQLGEDGRVAFIADLTPGVGGVDATNSRGIWVGTSATDLQLLVRTGQTVAGKLVHCLPEDSSLHQLQLNRSGVLWVDSCRFFGANGPVVLSTFDSQDSSVQDNP